MFKMHRHLLLTMLNPRINIRGGFLYRLDREL